ncbi:MAG: ABC transporter permease subunit [Myxococcota bacterium]
MPDLSRVRALVAKDLYEAMAAKGVVTPTLVVPFMISVFVPLVVLGGGALGQSTMKMDPADADKLFGLYAIPPDLATVADRMMYVFLNHMYVPMFLILPVMASTLFATHGIVSEKEHRTLETLLQTPLRASELIAAKLLGALVPAIVIGWISFGLFALSTLVGGALFGRPVGLSLAMWLPVVVLLSPAVSLVGLSVSLVVSLKARTFAEAQQTSGVVVLPFVATMIGATTGYVTISPAAVVWAGLALLGAGVAFLAWLAPRLDRERLIQTL